MTVVLKGLAGGKEQGRQYPPSRISPSSARIYHSLARVGGCPLLAARGALGSSMCGQQPQEAQGNRVVSLGSFGHLSPALNYRTELALSLQTLATTSVVALVSKVDYENMKINNSLILLFSGRQAFLFIALFIVGCHKYSRIIIPG